MTDTDDTDDGRRDEARADRDNSRDDDDARADCDHAERTDGQCTACGDCLHELILNGACYICGTTEIDGVAVSPKPAAQIIPAARLTRDPRD